MANTAYSQDFLERVIQCFLNRGKRSARDIAKEFGISHSTLGEWLSGLSLPGQNAAVPVLAEDWPAAKKFQTVSLFDALQDEERGEFLRKQGLTTAYINRWRSALLGALDTRDQEKIRLEQRVRSLEKELEKKDKALAEAAALLILQKKSQRLFLDEE
ncbi:hypothetical protein EBR21_09260 [bacterium]|nr:hypothetical protein [bacterium]